MEAIRDRPSAPREEPLETRARKRVRARYDFVVHLVIFLVGNLGIYAIWRLSGARYPWFLWILVPWSTGLVGHGLTLLIGPESTGEDRAVQKEISRLRPRPQER